MENLAISVSASVAGATPLSRATATVGSAYRVVRARQLINYNALGSLSSKALLSFWRKAMEEIG